LLCHTYCIKLSKGSPGSPGRPYNNQKKSFRVLVLPHLLHKAFKGISGVSWQALQQQQKNSFKVLALPHLLHKNFQRDLQGLLAGPTQRQKSHSESLLCHTYCIKLSKGSPGSPGRTLHQPTNPCFTKFIAKSFKGVSGQALHRAKSLALLQKSF
jgi:hypothetical protein